MTTHFLKISAALALVLASPVSDQQTLNVRDADIRAFIQDAARVTGRTFIIDQRVQGKVSVVTDRPLSRSEYFEIFLSTLRANRSEEHTSELQSLMRISYAVFCLKKKKHKQHTT